MQPSNLFIVTFFTLRQNNDVGVKRSFAPFDLGIKIIIVIRYLKVKEIPRELRNLSILMPSSCFLS